MPREPARKIIAGECPELRPGGPLELMRKGCLVIFVLMAVKFVSADKRLRAEQDNGDSVLRLCLVSCSA